MRGLWLFIHVIGFTLWLGGGIATMVAGVSAKSFDPGPRLAAYKLIGNIQRLLVGPGAIAVVLSGIVLAMPYMRSGAMPGWLNLMMGAGLLGALAAVGLSVPTAARMGRLELDARGELPELSGAQEEADPGGVDSGWVGTRCDVRGDSDERVGDRLDG